MFYILLWLFIIIFLLVLLKLLKIKKNYIICLFITLFIILFIVNIKLSLKASLNGAKLWFKAILPTSFPFAVICNLLIFYDGITLYSKLLGPLICKPLNLSKNSSFPLTVSFLCGYPLGSKFSSDTYDLGYIDRNEYISLINIATNCGPLFIIGTVGCAMLNNISYGYLLLIGNYLSVIIIGLFTRKKRTFSKNKEMEKIPENTSKNNLGYALKKSLEDGINTALSIGGFIIIFSVLIEIIQNSNTFSLIISKIESLLHLEPNLLYAIFLGSIEITNGCNMLSSSSLPISLKLSLISFLCSFSGLSIIAQSYSFMSKHNISLLRYFLFKLFQGILSFFITFIFSNLLTISTSNIFNISSKLSFYVLLVPIILLILIFIISKLFSKLLLHIL